VWVEPGKDWRSLEREGEIGAATLTASLNCKHGRFPLYIAERNLSRFGACALMVMKAPADYCCCSLMLPMPPLTERWMVVGDLP